MTNRERLLSILGFDPSDKNSLDGEMLDFSIDGSATYSSSSSLQIKRCAVNIIKILLSTADTTNENGYHITYDRPSVLKRLSLLEAELNEPINPKIRGIHPW